jgi:hypothetical protein
MKNTSNIFVFVTLIHLLACLPFLLQAQKNKEEYDQKVADKLATMDLSGVKNGFLLNKGVFSANKGAKNTTKRVKIDLHHTMYSKIVLNFVKIVIDSKQNPKQQIMATQNTTSADKPLF